jgi:hypothetical protein
MDHCEPLTETYVLPPYEVGKVYCRLSIHPRAGRKGKDGNPYPRWVMERWKVLTATRLFVQVRRMDVRTAPPWQNFLHPWVAYPTPIEAIDAEQARIVDQVTLLSGRICDLANECVSLQTWATVCGFEEADDADRG